MRRSHSTVSLKRLKQDDIGHYIIPAMNKGEKKVFTNNPLQAKVVYAARLNIFNKRK